MYFIRLLHYINQKLSSEKTQSKDNAKSKRSEFQCAFDFRSYSHLYVRLGAMNSIYICSIRYLGALPIAVNVIKFTNILLQTVERVSVDFRSVSHQRMML